MKYPNMTDICILYMLRRSKAFSRTGAYQVISVSQCEGFADNWKTQDMIDKTVMKINRL